METNKNVLYNDHLDWLLGYTMDNPNLHQRVMIEIENFKKLKDISQELSEQEKK